MSVRVLRAGGGPAPRAVASPATARRIHAARWEARLEAERTLAEARVEAERLRREAHSRGRAEGHAEALAQLAYVNARAEEVAAKATDLVVAATRVVAERALGAALQDDARLRGWATEALASLGGARRLVVLASPATAARLQGMPGLEVHAGDVPDDALLATCELGDARVELRAQVEALVSTLSDLLAREVSARV